MMSVRIAACVGLVALLSALLAACASPSSNFYTLGPGNPDNPVDARSTAAPALLIEVPPVDVPPQVAKNQFVVQLGGTQVKVLEQERWASLPGDEIRRALSTSLTQQLGTLDVYGMPYPDGTPVYRVSVNVQRFESWPGSHALIDAVWSVRSVNTRSMLTCRSVVSEPVNGGYEALADGHRRAVQQISMQIAAAVRAMASAPHGAASVKGVATSANPAAGVSYANVPCPATIAAASGNNG